VNRPLRGQRGVTPLPLSALALRPRVKMLPLAGNVTASLLGRVTTRHVSPFMQCGLEPPSHLQAGYVTMRVASKGYACRRSRRQDEPAVSLSFPLSFLRPTAAGGGLLLPLARGGLWPTTAAYLHICTFRPVKEPNSRSTLPQAPTYFGTTTA